MIGDPMLIERVEQKIRDEKKCAEWAVAQACEEIGKLFGPAEPASATHTSSSAATTWSSSATACCASSRVTRSRSSRA